ncbi:hypothetical protein OA418_03245 [Candidatus Pelagibacter sp.]|nr:hypothetical protein [Candidatus Pelagibacter sp.]
MNIRDNVIFFLSFFPIFVIKSNFKTLELFLILILFVILCFFNFFLLKILNKYNVTRLLYKSAILAYGFDNHLGLFNGLIQPNIGFFLKHFSIIYIPSLLIIISLFLFIFFCQLKFSENNISKIFTITLLTIFSFNIFDNTKSHKSVPFFEKEIVRDFDKTTFVMIWDEMSGLDSLSSSTISGKEVNENFEALFKKYNFDYFPSAFSSSENSVASITSLLNFKEKFKDIKGKAVNPSKNYFVEYDVNQNLFFQKFESISVIQNIHLNYCNHKNVLKCYQYNPLNLDQINAETDKLSKIISSWSLNGSIIGKFVWRSLKQLNLINSTLEPEGEKLFVKNILDYSANDLLSKKFDLVFVHLLVPHKPYGFNKKCNYETKLSNLNIFMTKNEHILQHNIERKCVIKLIDHILKKIDLIDNFKIIIFSDHGSRITKDKSSSLSSIFAYKDFFKNYHNLRSDKSSIQTLFRKINDE